MKHVEPMDPHEAFAELGRIRLADIDIDALLDKISQLAKRTIPGASEVSVTLLHGNAPKTAAFTGELAGFAAVGLANVHLYETQATLAGHLQKAMDNRAVIEQAKGIIIGERRCTPDQAFAILTKVSQDTKRKVRDVATALVTKAHTTG